MGSAPHTGVGARYLLCIFFFAIVACAHAKTGGRRRRREGASLPEFEVTFRVRGPLGMVLDEYATVAGFRKTPEMPFTPAEQGGIRLGDAVVAVNGEEVDDPVRAAALLRAGEDGSLRVLRLRALGGEPRDSAVVDLLHGGGSGGGGGGGVDGVSQPDDTGAERAGASQPPRVMRYDAGSDGYLHVLDATGRRERIPFRLAAFSRPLSDCDLRRIVSVTPADGCGEVRADLHARDALVVVDRGACTFFDKAVNVAWAGAGVVVVANGDDGPLFAMPAGAGQDPAVVQAPVVLVSASNGALLRRLASVADPVQLAQLVSPVVGCSVPQLEALPTQTTMASGAGESQRLRVDAEGNVELGRPAPRAAGAGATAAASGGLTDEQEQTSQPMARGGTLYVSATATRAMLRPDNESLRRSYAARGTLPRAVAATPGAWFASGGGRQPSFSSSGDGSDDGSAATGGGQSPLVLLALDFLRADFGGPLVPSPWDPPSQPPLLVLADPAGACSDLRNLDEVEGALVAVVRGECALVDKVRRAQSAGAVGVVVLNTEEGLLAPRASGPSSSVSDVVIPAVMVSKEAGRALQQLLQTVRALAQRKAAEAVRILSRSRAPGAREAEVDAYLSEFRLQAPRAVMFGRPKVAEYWDELMGLHSPNQWPDDSAERHALYKRLARLHHPDKGGSHDRFTLLHAAYTAAEYFKAQLRQGGGGAGSTASKQARDEKDEL